MTKKQLESELARLRQITSKNNAIWSESRQIKSDLTNANIKIKNCSS